MITRSIHILVPLRFHLLVVYVILLSLLLLMPLPNWMPRVGPYSTAAHFVFFFLLFLLADFAHLFSSDWRILIATIAFGAVTESLQSLLPYRAFEWVDLAANTLGALSALAFIYALRKMGHLEIFIDFQVGK